MISMWCSVFYDLGLMAVFFFKQKTAYEMRISDWSSDVCSSDLDARAARAAALHHEQPEPAVISKRHIETAAADLGAAVGGGCDDDDRDVVVERAQMLEKFDPADPGHLHVGYDAGKAREIIYGQERLRTVESLGSNAGHLPRSHV